MLDDTLALVCDPVFNNYNDSSKYQSVFELPGSTFDAGHQGYSDRENLWTYVGSITES